jgi:hypothetical protein
MHHAKFTLLIGTGRPTVVRKPIPHRKDKTKGDTFTLRVAQL